MTISDNGPFSHSPSHEGSVSGATPNRDKPRDPVTIDAKAEGSEPIPHPAPQETNLDQSPSHTPDKEALNRPLIVITAALLGLTVINAYVLYESWDETKALNERLGLVEADPSLKSTQAQLAKLEQKLASLEARPSAQPNLGTEALSAFEKRLNAVEAQFKTIGAANEANKSETARLSQALSEFSGLKNNSASSPNEPALTQMNQRLAQIEATLATPKSPLRASEAKQETSSASLNDLTRMILAQTLVQSLEQGQPNARLIEALIQSGLPQDKAQILTRLTNPGTPDLRQLRDTYTRLMPALLKTEPEADGTSLLDKMALSASRLVKITPVQDGALQDKSFKDASTLILGIQTDLTRGDLASALLKWKDLPDLARKLSADWHTAADQRLQAQMLARTLFNDSLERLGRSDK